MKKLFLALACIGILCHHTAHSMMGQGIMGCSQGMISTVSKKLKSINAASGSTAGFVVGLSVSSLASYLSGTPHYWPIIVCTTVGTTLLGSGMGHTINRLHLCQKNSYQTL